MAYSYDFKDNVVYGAEDINSIRASILTKGVIEDSARSLKVLPEGNGIKILEGQAIFGDGCKIEVDSDGVLKEISAGVKNYVYLFNNTLAGVCEVIVSQSEPQGDYVLLAEIDEQGEISDKRQFAQLKTADAERYISSFTANFGLVETTAAGTVVARVTLPKNNCSMIDMHIHYSRFATHVKIFPKEDCFCIWDALNLQFGSGNVHSIYIAGGYGMSFKYEVSGNVLTIIYMGASLSNKSSEESPVTIAGHCVR